MKPILIYITTSSKDEALKISQKLLEQKLIACSNVLENMTSQYFWQGKLDASNECVLLLKSFKEKYPDIEKIVLKNHSYETPCLLTIPIENVNSSYLDWMKSQMDQ